MAPTYVEEQFVSVFIDQGFRILYWPKVEDATTHLIEATKPNSRSVIAGKPDFENMFQPLVISTLVEASASPHHLPTDRVPGVLSGKIQSENFFKEI